MDQSQTSRYVSRFEPLLYVPAFTQKDFHYVHTGNLHREICKYKVRSTQLLSPTPPPLHKRQGTKPKQQSPLHKRDKGSKSNYNHNHLFTRGIITNPKLNHLYTRGIGTKPKQTTSLKHHHLYTRGKAQSQIKGGITILVITKITNNSW